MHSSIYRKWKYICCHKASFFYIPRILKILILFVGYTKLVKFIQILNQPILWFVSSALFIFADTSPTFVFFPENLNSRKVLKNNHPVCLSKHVYIMVGVKSLKLFSGKTLLILWYTFEKYGWKTVNLSFEVVWKCPMFGTKSRKKQFVNVFLWKCHLIPVSMKQIIINCSAMLWQ